MDRLTRRQLIRLAAFAGTGIALPTLVHGLNIEELLKKIPGIQKNPTKVPPPVEGFRFGMVIDLGLCIGCRRCSYACKLENSVPDTISPPYIMVFETDPHRFTSGHPLQSKFKEKNRLMYTRLRKDMIYMPVQCNHCEDAPCTKVCPTKATYKSKDGIVMIDYDKCIGCRYCMAACPYNARRFNWWEPHVPEDKINPLVPVRPHGVVEKCTFCVHRTRLGKTTRCVEVCPNRARTFGNLNDPDSPVSKLVNSERNIRLKEGLNTGPQIWYLTQKKNKPMQWFKPLPPPKNVRGVMG